MRNLINEYFLIVLALILSVINVEANLHSQLIAIYYRYVFIFKHSYLSILFEIGHEGILDFHFSKIQAGVLINEKLFFRT